ncbi:putative adhesin [Cohnella sp. SGD-V74]|uniref:DUF4097 family beta strand repeat-containing protein n=1 Tax=unclassified Cohnella TaxID=2636738 RepID=UPI000D45A99B|nr:MULTISPECIES: DUF4097 family beta strand repeat-containing protein [unclassified Cohnella]PRX74373.1 putative adhesin [Cohnella sp. SGD-V74]
MKKGRNSAKLFAIIVLAASLTACGDLAGSFTEEVQGNVIGAGSGSGKLVSLEKQAFAADGFDELQVRTEAMVIHIAKGSGDKAEVELLADDSLRDRLAFGAEVESGVLKVEVEEKAKAGVLKDQRGERTLRIVLPDKAYRSLTIRNTFGAIEASGVKTELADIRIDAGSIRLSGVGGQLNLEANAGEIVVEDLVLSGDVKARTDVGKIAIHLSESPTDASFNLDSEVGEVKLNLEQVEYGQQASNKKVGTIGSNGYRIDAYTAVGEIVVDVKP